MNKEEFAKYIKSFNKNPGEYTDEEVYDICVKHKSLPASDKSWNALVILLGVNKTAASLRKWTYRKQEEDGTVTRNKKLLTEKTVAELTPTETQEKLNEQIAELYIAKTQVRDVWNSYRRNLRDEARIRSMQDSLIKAANSVGKLPEVEALADIYSLQDDAEAIAPKEAILMLSDLHIGASCNNYYNKYDSDVAAARLAKLVADTIRYCHDNNVTKLNVLNMGDMIHGLIHVNARLEQELDVTQQIITASELLAHALNKLQEAAIDVTYRSVTDNHSRAVANKNEHIEKENFNMLIDWYLIERLKDTSIEFIDDNIDIGIGKFTLDNGQKVIFSHGHEDKKSSCIQDMVGLTHEWIDYVLMAHFHNAAEHTFQNAKVFINGSIIGTESYAFGKRLFSKASQKLLIFDNTNVMDINIML